MPRKSTKKSVNDDYVITEKKTRNYAKKKVDIATVSRGLENDAENNARIRDEYAEVPENKFTQGVVILGPLKFMKQPSGLYMVQVVADMATSDPIYCTGSDGNGKGAMFPHLRGLRRGDNITVTQSDYVRALEIGQTLVKQKGLYSDAKERNAHWVEYCALIAKYNHIKKMMDEEFQINGIADSEAQQAFKKMLGDCRIRMASLESEHRSDLSREIAVNSSVEATMLGVLHPELLTKYGTSIGGGGLSDLSEAERGLVLSYRKKVDLD